MRAHPFEDRTTRLDRNEPALNTALPGDVRDTTEPFAMANAVALLLTTDTVLSAASSARLAAWMRACETGTDALRAGVPRAWKAGDKTGSGAYGTRNDVAIVYRHEAAPIVVAAYLTGAIRISERERDAILAPVGHVVASSF